MAGKLKYRFLGNSGLQVSEICFGNMTFGEKQPGLTQSTEEEGHAILDRFVEWGGNFIDTADTYTQGKAEIMLGNWLVKQKRQKFVIATKVRNPVDEDHPNSSGLSRCRIMQAVEDSLRRLQTDYIDLYQCHVWDSGTPIEETLCALNDLVSQGKVRYIGGSNFTGWQLQKVADICRYRNWAPFVSLQQQWNLLERNTELEVTEVCKNEGIGLLPWSPLKGGWLTGKYQRGMSDFPAGSRIGWASANQARANQSHPSYQQWANKEQTWDILDTMKKIADQQDKTQSQVAIRWLLDKDIVPSVVIGAKTIKQLDDNLGAGGDWKLTPQQMAELDEVSAYPVVYPYEVVRRVNKPRQRTQ